MAVACPDLLVGPTKSKHETPFLHGAGQPFCDQNCQATYQEWRELGLASQRRIKFSGLNWSPLAGRNWEMVLAGDCRFTGSYAASRSSSYSQSTKRPLILRRWRSLLNRVRNAVWAILSFSAISICV
jgi:hypothetical protein